jgi:alpha-amylase
MKIIKLSFLFLILFALVSCIPNFLINTPSATSNVMYQIFVRSFYDSDGDGIGDLRGVAEKAQYLKDLGVDIVWLMPINKAHSYHGYDPLDLFSIEEDYGDFDDFMYMVNKLHAYGIRIILDLVINHTSDQNPLFKDAIENTKSSKYWNWFILSLEDHTDQFGWHYKINSKGQKVWYFGLFDLSMPDYNFEDEEVKLFVKQVVDFWLEKGVDGFRFDALKNIYGFGFDDGIQQSALYAKELAEYIYSKKSDAVIVGEVFTGNRDDLMSFWPMPVLNFSLRYQILDNKEGTNNLITNGFLWYNDPLMRNYLFLDSHDENRFISDLEAFYSNSTNPRFYSEAQFAIWNTVLLSLKGVPIIYYGDEIGLRGYKWNDYPSSIPVREPMQWYKSGDGIGQTFWTKEKYANINFGNANIDGSMYDDPNDGISVEEQKEIPNSLYNYLKKVINIRKKYLPLSRGDMVIRADFKNLIAIERYYGNEQILMITNPDPFSDAQYVVPDGYKLVFFADLNNHDTGFIFEDRNIFITSNNQTFTIKPRQVYFFYKE